jgi:hypothetical protein
MGLWTDFESIAITEERSLLPGESLLVVLPQSHSNSLMDEESFRKACGAFDIDACTSQLAALSPDEIGSAPEILENQVRQTGCLINPRISAEAEAKRAAFIEFCRNYMSGQSDQAVLEAFDEHLAEVKLMERAYRAVLTTLKEYPSGQWEPDVQLWAAFGRAAKEVEFVYNQMKKPDAIKGEFFDPMGAKITRDGAPDIDPDFVVTSATRILGATIMMLAWDNGWNAGGILVIPNRRDVEEEKLLQAGITAYLGQVWRAFKESDDHLRYFGGELVLKTGCTVTDSKDMTHTIDVLNFDLEQATTHADQIAHERLNRAKFGFMNQLEQTTNAAGKVAKTIEGTPLSPQGYISFDEIHTYVVLADLYCLPVDNDMPVYKGLAFKHWLRGYAVLKEVLAHKDGEPIIEVRSFAEDDLVQIFTKAGLTGDQATAFIAATTFSKGRTDLFDTPFVRSADGKLHFFAPAYVGAQLSSIVISMLSANRVQFQKKGTVFEEKVRKRLTASGLNVKGFKFKAGEKELECDAAFIWDKTLFVFECKNNSLSGLGSIASFRFLQGMGEAVDQVERIRDAFSADPDTVKLHLGKDAEWTAIVPCVINAMPWSPGKLGDVYFYDSSALTKFLEQGYISFEMPITIAEKVTIKRRHKFPLWVGSKPTANDLLRQMEKPIQVQLIEEEWEIDAPLALLSRQLGFVSPFWKRKSPDTKRSLKACGMEDAAIEKLLSDFREASRLASQLKKKL